MRFLAFGAVLFIFLTSCGRNTDFIYHRLEAKPDTFSTVHKLKEMQGENKVDILFIIDNSGSMGEHQRRLAANTEKFIDAFAVKGGLDWKIGIISTDVSNNPFIGFEAKDELTYRTADNIKLFKAAVGKLGIMGSGFEQTFAPIQKWLKAYPDFLRPRAILALIMITDAPEQSRILASDFLNFLETTKKSLKSVVSYGAFAALDFSCPTSEGLNYTSSPYEEVINATNGKVYSLCKDFGTSLADMGNDLVSRVRRPSLRLKSRPALNTLVVKYKGKVLPGGIEKENGKWIYDFDINAIVFNNLDFAPGENEEVEVEYEFAKTAYEQ